VDIEYEIKLFVENELHKTDIDDLNSESKIV